jgi:hypothetical protein
MAPRIRLLVPIALALLILGSAPATAGVFDSFIGTYTGTWFNNTFQSAGPAQIDLAITGNDATMTATMGNNVFGIHFNPSPVVIPGTVNGNQIDFDTDAGIFGDVVATIMSDGSVSYTLTMIPGTSFMSITGSGTIGAGRWDMNYEIDVMPLVTYDGVVSLVPEPAGALQGVMALAALGGLRRASRSGSRSVGDASRPAA